MGMKAVVGHGVGSRGGDSGLKKVLNDLDLVMCDTREREGVAPV
jgi:hypothetical protein